VYDSERDMVIVCCYMTRLVQLLRGTSLYRQKHAKETRRDS
jgi:hypothetical protein